MANSKEIRFLQKYTRIWEEDRKSFFYKHPSGGFAYSLDFYYALTSYQVFRESVAAFLESSHEINVKERYIPFVNMMNEALTLFGQDQLDNASDYFEKNIIHLKEYFPVLSTYSAIKYLTDYPDHTKNTAQDLVVLTWPFLEAVTDEQDKSIFLEEYRDAFAAFSKYGVLDSYTRRLNRQLAINEIPVKFSVSDFKYSSEFVSKDQYEVDRYPSDGEFDIDWKYVNFQNGHVFIHHPHKFGIRPLCVKVQTSLPSMNKLGRWFERKVGKLRVKSVDGRITEVYNADIIGEAIRLYQEYINLGHNKKVKKVDESIYNHLTRSEAKDLVSCFKNDYLDYLCEIHLEQYLVCSNVERKNHAFTAESEEQGFVFTIKAEGPTIVAFENVEEDRASIIFLIEEDKYEEGINSIYRYFASDIENKREKLQRSEITFPQHSGIVQYQRVIHTDIVGWKSNLNTILKQNYR